MSDQKPRDVVPAPDGIFNNLANRVKLIFRLLADPRVNPILKLLPIGTLLYLLVPDLAPGPFDDALVIWIGGTLFVELCPPEVVEEHLNDLNRTIPGQWRDVDDDDEVIDTEYRDLE